MLNCIQAKSITNHMFSSDNDPLFHKIDLTLKTDRELEMFALVYKI